MGTYRSKKSNAAFGFSEDYRSVALGFLFEDLLSLSTRGQCDTFHKVMRISVFSITVLVTHCRDRGER